ncbi:3-vinyl bacteriochlorophyllide hydratase [Fulvimarina manganoxydans]|uniref:3-vinyl bacteriochlorophyllide hydratase n=2 Tax=Fulvimarina manganoxydans TaxID=937218 RepID=A0A1W2EVS9_9HYPH|nr:3-vinyl bacteriochlorophyllide hydratase [Fulvimarina manganoxydans]
MQGRTLTVMARLKSTAKTNPEGPQYGIKPAMRTPLAGCKPGSGLYTPEERRRRDESPWTLVQGILAPLQFLVFLISLALVLRALLFGVGETAAMVSILIKTLVLLTIMVTGSIWEKQVFGRWLFAPAFFWEDVVSFAVIALHLAYVVMLFAGLGTMAEQLAVALVAYAAYVVNAAQFLLKLRAARLEGQAADDAADAPSLDEGRALA